jgi:hypothetical protein
MINKQSDDPNVQIAAEHALGIIKDILSAQPKAEDFNYGGHELKLNDYGVCTICTIPIAEAQQLTKSLREKSETIEDEVIKEHLDLAAQLFEAEAQAAIIRAEFHNGHNTEPILNELLGYQFRRNIHDTYDHNHAKDVL